jgi:hypothetical protein
MTDPSDVASLTAIQVSQERPEPGRLIDTKKTNRKSNPLGIFPFLLDLISSLLLSGFGMKNLPTKLRIGTEL